MLIALLLRGHVRKAFNTRHLYDFLVKLCDKHNIDIYISTFNIKNAGKIYKDTEDINLEQVNEAMVNTYFGKFTERIKQLYIDQDGMASKINDVIIGKMLSKNKYHHMWKSIYNVTNMAKESNIPYDYIINMRIDYFDLIYSLVGRTCLPGMRKLLYIDIFKNFIDLIDINKNIMLLNINCDAVVKNTNIYNSKALTYFASKRDKERKTHMAGIIFDKDDILYGIDNVFAGKLDYIHKVCYVFAYNMDDVFDYLISIFGNLERYIRPFGVPHEVLLPLYIKNRLEQEIV